MSRFTLLCSLVLVCAACEGPRGEPGPTGPAGRFPYDRAKAYCTGGSWDLSSANNWTLTASCRAVADTPIEGWCVEPGGFPAGAYLADSQPVNWADTSAVAGWRCTWAWQNGATQVTFAGQAEICCAAP